MSCDCIHRKKIAVFGGSFNPPHIGHLALANYIAEYGGVDEVMMVVSPRNPLKRNSVLIDDNVRLQMMYEAVAGYIGIKVSDVEFKLERPSYSYKTLSFLKETNPDTDFVLVIGADNADCFDSWKDYDKILSEFEVMVYPRRGYGESLKFEGMKMINAPIIEVSSSFVRDAVVEGRDVRFFIPEPIRKTAVEHILKTYRMNDICMA